MRRDIARVAIAIAACGALGLAAATAEAAPPCAPEGPWVLATVREPAPRGLSVADALDRLGVELASRGMTLCTTAPAKPGPGPTATVTLAAPDAASRPQSVTLDVDVHDGARTKHASREVDLAKAPRDRTATVVALAADELLRAAADELALEQPAAAPPPASGAPAPVAGRDAADDATPLHPARVSLGARAAGEMWTGGISLLGADALVGLVVAPRARLELDLGARKAIDEQAAHGAIEAWAPAARLGGWFVLTRPGAAPEIAIGGRFGAYAVRVSGEPRAGAMSSADTSAALTMELGPSLRIPFRGGAALIADITGGGALRGVSAKDGERVVTGLSGFGLTTSVGFVMGVL